MTKRFTDIEHDYENARIRCKDNGIFMLYAIYEDDDGLTTLGYLLNEQEEKVQSLQKANNNLRSYIESNFDEYMTQEELNRRIKELEEENAQLKWSNKILRVNRKDCELGRRNERKNWIKMDEMRIRHIKFLQNRLKKNGLSVYMNDGD